jgi:hypothetical protein
MEANRRLNIRAIEFWTDYVPDPGNPTQTIARDMVKWVKGGDLSNFAMVEAVARMRRPMKERDGDMPTPNPRWEAIKGAYERWKSGQEVVEDGTALEAWPGLAKPQIKALRAAQIRTVEDLAAISDGNLGAIRLPDARKLRDRAALFLANAQGVAELDKALAGRDAKAAAQEAEIAELKAMIAAQQSFDAPRTTQTRGR